MLDDFLREDETNNSLDEPEGTPSLELSGEPETGFLGMTSGQRFILSLMFFFMVIIIGAFFLLVTGVIAIPMG